MAFCARFQCHINSRIFFPMNGGPFRLQMEILDGGSNPNPNPNNIYNRSSLSLPSVRLTDFTLYKNSRFYSSMGVAVGETG